MQIFPFSHQSTGQAAKLAEGVFIKVAVKVQATWVLPTFVNRIFVDRRRFVVHIWVRWPGSGICNRFL